MYVLCMFNVFYWRIVQTPNNTSVISNVTQYLKSSIIILTTFLKRDNKIQYSSLEKIKLNQKQHQKTDLKEDNRVMNLTAQRCDNTPCLLFFNRKELLKTMCMRVCSSDKSIRLVFDLLTFFHYRLRFSSEARRTQGVLSHVKQKLLFTGWQCVQCIGGALCSILLKLYVKVSIVLSK